MADFYIRQGDTASPLADTLKDAAGNPVDIQNADVALTLVPVGGGEPLLDAVTATNDQVGDGTDGSKGKVHYDWAEADTEAAAILFGSWTITYTDDVAQTFPNGSYLLVEISADDPVTEATRFASSTDLAARLGLEFTAADHLRANQLLALSSGLIRDAARQQISLHENDELTMPGTRSDRITLPERPIVSISSVTLSGSPLTEGTDWYLKGDTIYKLAHPAVFPSSGHYDRRLQGFGWPRQTLVITYTHGYADDDLPQLVKTTALEAVVRVWSNPEGLISERVGDTDVTFASYREPSRGLLLTEDERKQIRRFFGSRGVAVMVG